jgi:hypothetical protein
MLSASCLPPPSATAADRPSGQHRAERHDRPAVAAGDHNRGRVRFRSQDPVGSRSARRGRAWHGG